MQSQWDEIEFDLNRVIGKLMAIAEGEQSFDSLVAASYREAITVVRDEIAGIGKAKDIMGFIK